MLLRKVNFQSNDKTFTTQFVFRTNAKEAFSDIYFFFARIREGSLAILRRSAEYPIGWRVFRIQTNCPEGSIRTKENESRDLLRQEREIPPKLRACLADEQSRRTIKFSNKTARISQSNLQRREHRASKAEWKLRQVFHHKSSVIKGNTCTIMSL